MKRLTCLLLLGIGLTAQAQTDTYLSADFKKGIPSDFVLKDYSENPVMAPDFKAGRVKDTWSMYSVDIDSIQAAISTSRGEKDIAVDKWMITPSVKITSDKAWLSWDAKAIHYDLRDGYKVMISTTDQSPASFEEVFSIKAEDYFWAHHFISLKKYQGKNIYVAFVNNSYNKYILAITNLFIGIPAPGKFEVIDETPRFVGDISNVAVKGKIRNLGGNVKMSELTCTTNEGEPLKQSYNNLTLEPGETADFEFMVPVTVGKVANYKLKVTTDAHSDKEVLNDSVICSTYPLTLVAEEFTGTWCVDCPRGNLYSQMLKKRYKDQLISISAHYRDTLTNKVYETELFKWINNFPSFIYNRYNKNLYAPQPDYKYNDTQISKIILKPVEAKAELTAAYNDIEHKTISSNAKVLFAKDMDNSEDLYRLGYVIVEKRVTGTGSKFNQTNGLTVNQGKEFSFMPSPAPAHLMFYHDVPREADNAFEGIPNSLPAEIKAGEEYNYDYPIEIPANVTDKNNVSVVVFILDTKNKKILNACEVKNPTPHPEAVSIDEITHSISNTTVYQSADRQSIQLEMNGETTGETVYIQLTGLDGKILFSSKEKVNGTLSIPAYGLKGCFIVNLTTGNQTTSKKIMLN